MACGNESELQSRLALQGLGLACLGAARRRQKS
jgi:hypothetical protein